MIFMFSIAIIIMCIFMKNKHLLDRNLRRKHLKNMKIDERFEQLIQELNESIRNDRNFNKMRIKYTLFYIFVKIILWGCVLTYPAMFILLMLFDDINNTGISDFVVNHIEAIAMLFILTVILAFMIEEKIYAKYKAMFKDIVNYDLFPRINGNIYWTMDEISGVSVENNSESLNKFLKDFKNVNTEKFWSTAKTKFEDYWYGKYLNDFDIEVLDYKTYTESRRHSKTILDEGLFCKVFSDKHINDCIKIKIDGSKNEIDGEISNEIKEKIIDFGNKSKLRFNISIINDVIYFKFKSFDFFEPKKIGKPVDEDIIKEYLNIISFVIDLSKSILL